MTNTDPARRSFIDRFRRAETHSAHAPEATPAVEATDDVIERVPTLSQRMEAEYLAGYDARIQTGLAYIDADTDKRTALRANVLQAKAATYQELDQLWETLDRELPGAARFFDSDLAAEPLTPAAAVALERAAHLAGRWDDLDPVISDQLARIERNVVDLTEVASVTYAGDSREARFNYTDPVTQNADRGLRQLDRDTTEHLARGERAADEPAPSTVEANVSSGRSTSYPMPIAAALSASPTTPAPPVRASTAHPTTKQSLER